MYAVQEGLAVGKADPEAKAYLMGIMDFLQKVCDVCACGGVRGGGGGLVAGGFTKEDLLRFSDYF